ncbi:YceK/YidQ family lipoprotein [Candidatus Uabimicrobium amorphum]|uniref:YceK/YidQ family lipoprotein n=1 Tax=Uabimicrobium amorphum TaxID=2596890 RepID=A0A5S9F7S8_UABAM|nr:YceK/YidQ family lipoprotein [Candidatus Uabimicrobium amorphum]BBM88059.1 hypothetical protein UABAM_06475 [Candidatus Uabimicrobium amorphum]
MYTKRLLNAIFWASLVLSITACGTIQSQAQQNDFSENSEYIGPFSGVVYDGKWSVCNPLRLVDLPVSLAADVVIFPYTIYRANEKCRAEKCEAPE